MKKTYMMVIVVVAVMLLTAGMAMAAISETKHNLSSNASWTVKGDIAEICIYCHTPHGGDSTIPLWNRAAGTVPVTPYSIVSGTARMPNFLSGVSRACMTCHDGSTAINSMTNVGGSAKVGSVMITDPFTLLGSNMSNDHPVGVPMNPLTDLPAGYIDPGVSGNVAKTFGTTHTVECASCHDVHGVTGVGLFLRAANTDSALCFACHDK